jgi:EAL domain-containing protein (putative c-di-GMP-specific phosphodiesterase class I)
LAEETGLIVPIAEWVLRTACLQHVAWQSEGRPPLPIAVNLSGRQLLQGTLERTIMEILEETGCAIDHIEMEVTEGFLIEDPKRGATVLQSIRDLGIRLTIDDFGTGYSSLSYLQRLPLDVVKIDRSFVHHLPADRDSGAIVQAVIALAHSLRLKVIAEGVETSAQVAYLKAHGCDEAQGYCFSPPLPPAEFAAFVASWRGPD